MEGCEIAITATACAMAQDKSPEELGKLAALFVQLGDTLATLALFQ